MLVWTTKKPEGDEVGQGNAKYVADDLRVEELKIAFKDTALSMQGFAGACMKRTELRSFKEATGKYLILPDGQYDIVTAGKYLRDIDGYIETTEDSFLGVDSTEKDY